LSLLWPYKMEDVSHGNTRNLFSVSVGTTSSIHLM
jgi:hypothetical protein